MNSDSMKEEQGQNRLVKYERDQESSARQSSKRNARPDQTRIKISNNTRIKISESTRVRFVKKTRIQSSEYIRKLQDDSAKKCPRRGCGGIHETV